MRKNILILLVIFALIASSILFTGCQEDKGLSIDDRIRAFVQDLNSDSDNIRNNFHPSSAFRNSTRATFAGTWPFPGPGGPYSVGSISGSGSSRSVNIIGCIAGQWPFNMREDGRNNWYIDSIGGL
ncbi:MAG: hypothetical protein FWC36_04175 [Spirochaetes bacterium]|nr:hypothetical protein [Spirochaetota bacterium]